MKSFNELSPMETYQESRPKIPLEKPSEIKSINPIWEQLGGGLLMACGDKKEQAFKGWITTTDDIPKGTKIHCNLYDKSHGVSITLATLKEKI
jgi:hypothetical protein